MRYRILWIDFIPRIEILMQIPGLPCLIHLISLFSRHYKDIENYSTKGSYLNDLKDQLLLPR